MNKKIHKENIKISVQKDDFSIKKENDYLTNLAPETGAVVTFTGRVREFSEQPDVTGLFLEHYPGMTEKSLKRITQQAQQRWDIQRISVIHRIGSLAVEDQIVFVGVSSAHREAAFEAARYIMDYLKTEAPFWKKEITRSGEHWVEAREKDQAARARWSTPD
tara:strand:+ start:888 stop:1373 length:486 start_codon:yes stop_codon:yes gene_type:complete